MAQVLFFDISFEKDPHLNAIELVLKTNLAMLNLF